MTARPAGAVLQRSHDRDRSSSEFAGERRETPGDGLLRFLQRVGAEAPASVDRVLGEPGIPLQAGLRSDMEARFGHDFSRVRVHADAPAGQSAREVAARAYTVGHHIVFGAGRFAPATREGRRLVAHELTHVLQQTGPAALAGSRRPALPTTRVREARLARQPDIESVRSAARDLVGAQSPGTETTLPLDLERALRRIAGQGGKAGEAASRLLDELGRATNIASEQRDLNTTNAAAREFLRRHGIQPRGNVRRPGVASTIHALEQLAGREGAEASARRARELASQLRELDRSLGERQRDRQLEQRPAQYSNPKTKPEASGKTPLKPSESPKTATEAQPKPTPETKPAVKPSVTPKVSVRQGIRVGLGAAGGMAAGMAIGLLGGYFKAKYDAWSVDKQLRQMQPAIEARISAHSELALRAMVVMPEVKLYANVTISSTVVTVMEGYNVGQTSPSLELEAVGVGVLPLELKTYSYDAGYGWSSFTEHYSTAVPLDTPPVEDLIAYAKANALPLGPLRQHVRARLLEAGASVDSGAGFRRSAYWRERLQELEGTQ